MYGIVTSLQLIHAITPPPDAGVNSLQVSPHCCWQCAAVVKPIGLAWRCWDKAQHQMSPCCIHIDSLWLSPPTLRAVLLKSACPGSILY